jgi:hypothetical protein
VRRSFCGWSTVLDAIVNSIINSVLASIFESILVPEEDNHQEKEQLNDRGAGAAQAELSTFAAHA